MCVCAYVCVVFSHKLESWTVFFFNLRAFYIMATSNMWLFNNSHMPKMIGRGNKQMKKYRSQNKYPGLGQFVHLNKYSVIWYEILALWRTFFFLETKSCHSGVFTQIPESLPINVESVLRQNHLYFFPPIKTFLQDKREVEKVETTLHSFLQLCNS